MPIRQPHFPEKGRQRMCRKHSPGGCWNVLELTPGPRAALAYQSLPSQPSIQVLGNCFAPTAPGRQVAQSSYLPKALLLSLFRDRNQLAGSKVGRIPETEEEDFRARDCWPGGLQSIGKPLAGPVGSREKSLGIWGAGRRGRLLPERS